MYGPSLITCLGVFPCLECTKGQLHVAAGVVQGSAAHERQGVGLGAIGLTEQPELDTPRSRRRGGVGLA